MKKIISALFMTLMVIAVIHFNATTANADTILTSSDITKEWTINKSTTQMDAGTYIASSGKYLLYKVTASEAGTYLISTRGNDKYSTAFYTAGYLLDESLNVSSPLKKFSPGDYAYVISMKKNETVYFAIGTTSSGYCGSTYTFDVVMEPATIYNEMIMQNRPKSYDADGDGRKESNGYYILGNTITKSTALTIPAKYKNVPIVFIKSSAFEDCDYITSVSIPSTVQTVDSWAFKDCQNLKKAVVNAMWLDSSVFLNCKCLESVTIGSGVKYIESSVFANTAIKKLYIPATVSSIDDGICNGTYKLTSITVNANNENYKSVNGVLFSKDGKTIMEYPRGNTAASYTIPDGVETIAESCFNGAINLKKVVLPDSVTNIEGYAFCDCINLSSVSLNKGLLTIGNSSFFSCTKLVSIGLPNTLTSIGQYAFKSTSLLYIVMPASVTSVGGYAFYNCADLQSIIVRNDALTFPSADIIESDQSVTIYGNSGSTAQTYANNESNIKFVNLSSYDCKNGKHTYYAYKYKAAPTCTSYGKAYTRCAKCGAAGSLKTVDKEAHNVINNGRCAKCGKARDVYKNVTLGKAIKCMMFSAKGSSENEGSFVAAYKAKKTGKYKITVSGANQDMDVIYCVADSSGNIRLNQIDVDVAKGQSLSIGIKVKAGETLYVESYASYYSTKDYVFTTQISCVHEKYTTKVVKPTYAAKGYTLYTCTVCGHSYKTNYTNKLTVAATTLKSVTAGKQKLLVKWNKKNYTGYQVQIATDANFTKNRKTVTIKGSTNLSKVVTGLKSGTKYYVRVRTYVTYNKKNYYSAWSKAVLRTVK